MEESKNKTQQDSFTLETAIKNQDVSSSKSQSVSEFFYAENDTMEALNVKN